MASCAFGAEMTGSWSKLFLFLELPVAVILMLARFKIHTVLPAEIKERIEPVRNGMARKRLQK
jgi:hypothetical protein